MKKAIPISVVKEFASEEGYDHVIVLAYDSKTNTECVATWGKDEFQCEAAARIGNLVKLAIGWPENLCNDKPARQLKREKLQAQYEELKELLQKMQNVVEQPNPDDVTNLAHLVALSHVGKHIIEKHKQK